MRMPATERLGRRRIATTQLGDGVRMEQHRVARALAVERETVAAGADVDDPRAPRKEAQRLGRAAACLLQLAVSRLERILGEGREDVGQQQFLVLLLVIDAQFDQGQRVRRKVW